jgi:hypothetical protein
VKSHCLENLMSTRERWIVYPLLFLALGTAIKPKLVPPELRGLEMASGNLQANRIICRSLDVVDDDSRPYIRMTTSNSTKEAEIQVINRRGKPVISLHADAATRAGLIETLNDDGRPQTAMMSSATGGEIAAFDIDRRRSVALGHRDGRFGLIETNLLTGRSAFVPISQLTSD